MAGCLLQPISWLALWTEKGLENGFYSIKRAESDLSDMTRSAGIMSQRQLGDGTDSVPQTSRVPSINFKQPEACPFLKEILRTCASGTAHERLCAVQDLTKALPDPEIGSNGEAVGVVVHLLENGLLPVIIGGLERASRGDWVDQERDPEDPSGDSVQLVNKAVIYSAALRKLAHDTRSTSYILQHAPHLLETLERLYIVGSIMANLDDADLQSVLLTTRLSILTTLYLMMTWSPKSKIQGRVARLDAFLSCLLSQCLKNPDDITAALSLLLKIVPFMPKSTFKRIAVVFLKVVVKVLKESESRHQIELVLVLIIKVDTFHFPTYRDQFLRDPVLIDCAKAVILCTHRDPISSSVGSAIVWSAITQHKTGLPIEEDEYQRIMSSKGTEDEQAQMMEASESSHFAIARAKKLQDMYAQPMDTSLIAQFMKSLAQDKMEESRISKEESQAKQNGHRRPPRKCSAAGCRSFESRSEEFQVCGQCKLTAYCSRSKPSFEFIEFQMV